MTFFTKESTKEVQPIKKAEASQSSVQINWVIFQTCCLWNSRQGTGILLSSSHKHECFEGFFCFFLTAICPLLQLWGQTRPRVPDTLLQVLPQQHLPGSPVLLWGQPLHQTHLHAGDSGSTALAPGLLDHPRWHRGGVPAPSCPDGVSHSHRGQRAQPEAQPQLPRCSEGRLGTQHDVRAGERGGRLRLHQRA